ncbi:MAG: hypothetical protein ABI748_01455 [Dokdonella sp.]
MQDYTHDRLALAAGHGQQTHQTHLALDKGHDVRQTLADDRVAFSVTDTSARFHERRTLMDPATTKTLTLPHCAAAVSSFASAQVSPQRAATLTILGDMRIDALVAHRSLAATGDLIRTPVFAQSRFDLLPLLGIDPGLRTGCATSFGCTVALILIGFVRHEVREAHVHVQLHLPAKLRRKTLLRSLVPQGGALQS